GFVRPLTGRHAGSLLTGWLDVNQVGFAHGTHPLGNDNQYHEFSPNAKVSGFPWREHTLVRLRTRYRTAGNEASLRSRTCQRGRLSWECFNHHLTTLDRFDIDAVLVEQQHAHQGVRVSSIRLHRPPLAIPQK